MERRKTLCAVGAVALAAVLAGCGDVTDNEVPVDQVKKDRSMQARRSMTRSFWSERTELIICSGAIWRQEHRRIW